MTNNITMRNAAFSRCRTYRYALWRIWDSSSPHALFIALNPSTADETADDPTVIRCLGYARTWGYGGLAVANLFAYRTTFPRRLKVIDDPVGPENDAWIARLVEKAGLVLVAWGNLGTFQNRYQNVLDIIPDPLCLSITRLGQPAHPLYLKKNLIPFRYPFLHQAIDRK